MEDVVLDFEGKFTKALDRAFQKKTVFRVSVSYDVLRFVWNVIQSCFLQHNYGSKVIYDNGKFLPRKHLVDLPSLDGLRFLFKKDPLPRRYGDQEMRFYSNDKIKLSYEYAKAKLVLSVPISCFDEDVNSEIPLWPVRTRASSTSTNS